MITHQSSSDIRSISMETSRLIYIYFLFSLCSSQEPPLDSSEELPCSTVLSVDISAANEYPINSGVFHQDNVTYYANNYFTDDTTGKRLGCICNIKKCIRKCCDTNYYMSDDNNCVSENRNFTLSIYDDTQPDAILKLQDFFMLSGFDCPQGYDAIEAESKANFFLQKNGSLYYEGVDWTALYDLDLYCMDLFSNKMSAFLCEPSEEDEMAEMQRKINGTGLLISMPFLFLTFLVYFILPERNLHRRALMCYVITSLAANITLVTIQLYQDQFPPVSCHIIGYLIIFFFLVSFFWLNVMCIDMWLAFSSSIGFLSKKTAEKKRFIIYSIYAWGTPFCFVIMVFLINTYGDKDSPHHPNLGYKSCFITEGLPTFYYFYLPMAILVGVNIVLFTTTSIKIYRIKKETKMLKRTDSRIHTYEDDKQKFKLYLKLMFAMGVNWIMELISWAVVWKYDKVPREIFYVTDFTNAIYGFLIFIIFVFKRKIWRGLQKRYYAWIGKPELAPSTSTRGAAYSTETVVSTDNYTANNLSPKLPEQIPLKTT